MSSHNNTAPRFRAQAASPLAGAAAYPASHPHQMQHPHGHHYASDIPPRLASALPVPLGATAAAVLAPPPSLPPPRHLTASQPPTRSGLRYGGGEHKFGPSYNDDNENNFDDVDFLASKMAAMSATSDRNANHYHNMMAAADLQRRVQAQHQLLQLQMAQQQQQQQQQQQAHAQALQSLLLQSADPGQLREAMALLELQRAQLAATTPSTHLERAYAQQAAAQQVLNQRILQQQVYALQAQQANQHHGHQQQRHALAAQLEAGTLRRERERERMDRRRDTVPDLSPELAHDKARAAFENTPSGYFPPISPPVESAAGVGWTTLASGGSGSKTPTTAPLADWPTSYGRHNSSPSASTRTSSTDSNTRAPSPAVITSSPTLSSTQPSAALGRFARARQELAAAQAAAPNATPLAALLSRGRSVDEDTISISSVATSPISETGPYPTSSRKWSIESNGRQVASDSGHLMMKEPVSFLEWGYLPPAPRSQSFSSYSRPTTVDVTRRQGGQSTPANAPTPTPTPSVPSLVLRQPFGPPGSADELRVKNFASNIRRQAGINLGMLRRRDSGEPEGGVEGERA